MDWLVFLFALELGIARESITIPFRYAVIDETQTTISGREYDLEWSLYTQLESGIELFDLLYFIGTARIYENPIINDFSFNPFRADFLFDIYISKQKFKLGYQHLCIHSILTATTKQSDRLIGGSDRFYFRIESKK